MNNLIGKSCFLPLCILGLFLFVNNVYCQNEPDKMNAGFIGGKIKPNALLGLVKEVREDDSIIMRQYWYGRYVGVKADGLVARVAQERQYFYRNRKTMGRNVLTYSCESNPDKNILFDDISVLTYRNPAAEVLHNIGLSFILGAAISTIVVLPLISYDFKSGEMNENVYFRGLAWSLAGLGVGLTLTLTTTAREIRHKDYRNHRKVRWAPKLYY